LLGSPDVGEEIISILRQIISEMATKDLDTEAVEVKINVKIWGIVGCHELLASLGENRTANICILCHYCKSNTNFFLIFTLQDSI